MHPIINYLFLKRIHSAVVFLLSYSSLVWAESADTIRTYQLQNVVVQEKIRPIANRSGAPFQVLTGKMLRTNVTNSLSDAVRRFSGVSVKDYGGIGGLKTISIRSMGAQHTAVSYDGITVSDCQSGQIDISRFSLDNVSQLSMTIGQSDDIYQTARIAASAGALNIETYKPKLEEESAQQLRANLQTGSYGLVNSSVFYNYNFSSKFAVTAHAEYLRADGKYPFSFNVRNKRICGDRINSDIESYRGELNLFGRFAHQHEVSFKFYYFDSERGLPGAIIVDNLYTEERLFDRNGFAQFKYEYRPSEKFKLKSALKWNYSWNRNYNNESTGIKDDRFEQTEYYATATAFYEPLKGVAFSLSEDFSYNDLNTTVYGCQYPERFSSLTVLAAQYKNNRITATASLLNTFITERVKSGDCPEDRKKLSPAFSISVRPVTLSSFRIRASYKDIFRVPTFNDMYYLLIGNTNLKPESTRQFNLGATWSGTLLNGMDYASISVDGYHNRVKDKIVAIPTMFIWKMMNADKVETWGADVNLAGNKKFSDKFEVLVAASYSFMQAENISDPNSKIWKHQLPYTPKHSGNGSLTVEMPWFNVGYSFNYASVRYSLSQNNSDNQIAAYIDHSLSLNRQFIFGQQKLNIQVAALNLGNRNYEIIKSYPMPGRNYRITLSYTLF